MYYIQDPVWNPLGGYPTEREREREGERGREREREGETAREREREIQQDRERESLQHSHINITFTRDNII